MTEPMTDEKACCGDKGECTEEVKTKAQNIETPAKTCTDEVCDDICDQSDEE